MCQVIQPPKDYMITRRETWLVVTETVYRVPAWSEGEAMAQFQKYEPMALGSLIFCETTNFLPILRSKSLKNGQNQM